MHSKSHLASALGLVFGALVAGMTTPAAAEDTSARLFLEAPIAGFQSLERQGTGDSSWLNSDSVQEVFIGPSAQPGSRLVYRPPLDLGLSFALGRILWLGARLGIGHVSSGSNPSSNTAWSALPFAELRFRSHVFVPFVLIELGYEGNLLRKRTQSGERVYDRTLHLLAFGGGGGLSLQPHQAFSIDVTMIARGALGQRRATALEAGAPVFPSEESVRTFLLEGRLGLSLWL